MVFCTIRRGCCGGGGGDGDDDDNEVGVWEIRTCRRMACMRLKMAGPATRWAERCNVPDPCPLIVGISMLVRTPQVPLSLITA
jgi:hypothetical protein